MNKLLRILHLEDEPDYSALVASLLQNEGIATEVELVETQAAFEAALAQGRYDLILADYLLPTYNGIQALQAAHKRCPDTPFLLVSGTIGEQAAIESLKAGATDYILKLWPERLVPAIRRAVQEAEERAQRHRAETELLRREKFLRALTENALDVVTILNREGNILYESPSLKRVLGYEPLDLVGQNAFSLVHPEDLPQARQAFETGLRQPERTIRLDFRFRHQDGSWRYLEAVGQSHLDDPAIAGAVINSRDVTDRKQAEAGLRELEEQLRQSQKMEAIGQLAGGVAHDFNNILTVIHGHASLLQADTNLAGPSARSAHQIIQAAERAAALTRQLLAFSRRQVLQPRRLDLNAVVKNLSQMLERILGEDIELRLRYSPEPAFVLADASMIEQVLLNLAINSRDAMPHGGRLTLQTAVRDLTGRRLAQPAEARSGRFVSLSVQDTGCGIPREHLPHIFEPFFTTKEFGKGTGLGLATVYGIVKQHQGWVEVKSEVGHGARFDAFLPCAAEGAEAAARPPAEAAPRGGTETILVVEDEPPVRELVCRLLARYGYRILQAESGIQALEVWSRCKNEVDLVLTDVIMPDRMNGRELAEKLWAERPKLKVIFTSGYSEDVLGKDFVLRPGLNYLQKPYHPQRLAAAVRQCLDAVN